MPLVPAKLLDPVFGPRVITGFVITADFSTYCSFKPIARVGDQVFVVGTLGPVVIAEVGMIISGCNLTKLSSPGGGSTSNIFSGDNSPTADMAFNSSIDFDLIQKVDPNLVSDINNTTDPNLLKDYMDTAIYNAMLFPESTGSPTTEDDALFKELMSLYQPKTVDGLKDKIKNATNNFLNNLNDKLKKGFCLPCEDKNNSALKSELKIINGDFPKMSAEGANYLSNINKLINDRIRKIQGNSISSIPLPLQPHELQVGILQSEIESNGLVPIVEKLADITNGIDSIETGGNQYESFNNINSTLQTLGLAPITRLDSITSKLAELQTLKSVITEALSTPSIKSLKSAVKCNPTIKTLIGDEVDLLELRIGNLVPLVKSDCNKNGTVEINKDNTLKDHTCADIMELQQQIEDDVLSFVELMNGKRDADGLSRGNIGVMANIMRDLGITDLKTMTGVAGLNPNISLPIYQDTMLIHIGNSISIVNKVKAYLKFLKSSCDDISSLSNSCSVLINTGTRDGFGDLLTSVQDQLTALLNQIMNLSLPMPSGDFKFALEVPELGFDYRNFIFTNMNPGFFGPIKDLQALLANPASLLPAANISALTASFDASISLCNTNITNLNLSLNDIIEPKLLDLNDMKSRFGGLINQAKNTLSSVTGCLPPVPKLSVDAGFSLGSAFQAAIDLQTKIPIPKLGPPINLPFPINFNFNQSLSLPPIAIPSIFPITPINIKLELNPKLNIPRLDFGDLLRIEIPRIPDISFKSNKKRNIKVEFGFNLPKWKFPLLKFAFPKFPNFRIPQGNNIKIVPGVVAGLNLDVNVTFPQLKLPKIPFPIDLSNKLKVPTYKIPRIKLPKRLFDLHKLNDLNLKYNIPFKFKQYDIPKFTLKFPKLPIPGNFNLPNLNIPSLKFGFMIPKIGLPILPIKINYPNLNFQLKLPKLTLGSFALAGVKASLTLPQITLPSISYPAGTIKVASTLKLPELPKLPRIDIPFPPVNLPSLDIPKLNQSVTLPKIAVSLPASIKLPQVSFDIPKVAIPMPAITLPTLCDTGSSNGTTNSGIGGLAGIAPGLSSLSNPTVGGGGRPMAAAMCSMWVSPHFFGWILPIPCGTWEIDKNKGGCMCIGI